MVSRVDGSDNFDSEVAARTWSTPTRVVNQDYTAAIETEVQITVTTGGSATNTNVVVGGVTIIDYRVAGTSTGRESFSFTVPKGVVYRVNSTTAPSIWAELS